MLSLHDNIFLETIGDIRVNSLAPFWGQASLAWMKQKETTKKGMLTSTILPTLQVWNGLNCLNSFLCFNLRSWILTHTNVYKRKHIIWIYMYMNIIILQCIKNGYQTQTYTYMVGYVRWSAPSLQIWTISGVRFRVSWVGIWWELPNFGKYIILSSVFCPNPYPKMNWIAIVPLAIATSFLSTPQTAWPFDICRLELRCEPPPWGWNL